MSGVRAPLRLRDWRLMGRTARLVLTVPGYAVVWLFATVSGLTLFVGSLSPSTLSFALTGPLAPESRLRLLVNLYPFVGSEYGPLDGTLLVGVAALFGANVAMLAYHLREHDLSVREGSGSAVGLVLGVLGAGCAACGTVVLAGVLSLVGVSLSPTLLPLDGLEFTLLALVALVLSTYWLADGMRGGVVNGCPIDP